MAITETALTYTEANDLQAACAAIIAASRGEKKLASVIKAAKIKVLCFLIAKPSTALQAIPEKVNRELAKFFDLACRENGKIVNINRASRVRIGKAVHAAPRPKLPAVIPSSPVDYIGRARAALQAAIDNGYSLNDVIAGLDTAAENI